MLKGRGVQEDFGPAVLDGFRGPKVNYCIINSLHISDAIGKSFITKTNALNKKEYFKMMPVYLLHNSYTQLAYYIRCLHTFIKDTRLFFFTTFFLRLQ